MKLSEERGVYVFDVQFEATGEVGVVALGSGAGVSVRSANKIPSVQQLLKKQGFKMVVANGSAVNYLGAIKSLSSKEWQGRQFSHGGRESIRSGFSTANY